MSGVDTELTNMTHKLLLDHGQAATDDERQDCVRSFVAQVNKRRHQTGEGGEGKKDVMLDLDMSDGILFELVAPAKPGTDPERWEVRANKLGPTQIVVDSPRRLIKIGSCLWLKGAKAGDWEFKDWSSEAGLVVLAIEPIWDTKGAEYKLCEVEVAR